MGPHRIGDLESPRPHPTERLFDIRRPVALCPSSSAVTATVTDNGCVRHLVPAAAPGLLAGGRGRR